MATKKAQTRGEKMSVEIAIAAIVAILVLVYLFYTLLRPEKF